MSHFIQRKNNIKITCKELSNSVINTYKVASILCFFYLRIKRWQHAAQQLNIIGYNIFIDDTNINKINFRDFDYVVDAIDTVSSKLLIIQKCEELNIPMISSMGTGNKLDPTKLLITDITKTTTCPLAKVIRKKCRELNIKHLTVLASTEEPIKTNTRNPGSMIFVPASAGLLIASYILRSYIDDEKTS